MSVNSDVCNISYFDESSSSRPCELLRNHNGPHGSAGLTFTHVHVTCTCPKVYSTLGFAGLNPSPDCPAHNGDAPSNSGTFDDGWNAAIDRVLKMLEGPPQLENIRGGIRDMRKGGG